MAEYENYLDWFFKFVKYEHVGESFQAVCLRCGGILWVFSISKGRVYTNRSNAQPPLAATEGGRKALITLHVISHGDSLKAAEVEEKQEARKAMVIELIFVGFKFPQLTEGKMSHLLKSGTFDNYTQSQMNQDMLAGYEIYIRPPRTDELKQANELFKAAHMTKEQEKDQDEESATPETT